MLKMKLSFSEVRDSFFQSSMKLRSSMKMTPTERNGNTFASQGKHLRVGVFVIQFGLVLAKTGDSIKQSSYQDNRNFSLNFRKKPS